MKTAIKVLIKFIKLVLTEINSDNFRIFSDLIYLIKKVLKLEDNFQSFISCPKYNKLY